MATIHEGVLSAKGVSFAVVVSRFNNFITDKLLEGTLDALKRHEASENNIHIFKVPGGFEIPAAAKKIAQMEKFDAIICLACIIRGATPHFDYVASETAKGIAQVSLEYDIPVTFGVLTTENLEQAIERAGAKSGNKGWQAALSAMEMVNLFREIGKQK
jgi:6,7-dimethyl-8-ribityllumazine synthase